MTDPAAGNKKFSSTPITRIGLVTLLVVLLTLFASAGWFLLYLQSPAVQQDSDTVTVTIPKGSSVKVIGEILEKADLVHADIRFLLLARFSGYGTRLQAGEFALPTEKKPLELLEFLASAKPVQYSVTIPEGLRIEEIAEIFSRGKWCDKTKFIALSRDQQFLNQLGFENHSSLEGYLFPDTYNFTKTTVGAAAILSRMVSRFTSVWQQLTAELTDIPDQLQTITLASIVEKETGAPKERNHIAGVFHNRLKTGMRLQSDPTVIYGTKKFGLPITRKDLVQPTSYNTYTLPGLPAGPICNPGKAAIAAVLSPLPTKNLYFVSKNDGTHKFSASLREHNRAVLKYQRKKTAKKGK
ncbi:MAG: endolytic transglycosylase MltG [Desulforhopalus sp.]